MGSITGATITLETTSLITFTGNVLSAGANFFGAGGLGNTDTQLSFALSTGTTTYESSWRRTPLSVW